jgi:formate hydrogenlyase subunit 4
VNAALAGVIQIAGGVCLAPLLPGLVQTLKARLQGRRGSSPLQPYRELLRLWGKTGVDPAGTSFVYRWAPCLCAAATLLVLPLLPIAGASPDWPLGNDALVVVGLLALARFAITASAWDTASGFALMGAARDLMIAVFAEGLLLLVVVIGALPAAGTDLVAMSAASAGGEIWGEPAHWCGAAAFALVLLVETGRQPIDNPDTHLELTMVHEGPLLEYAGRDLALLEWTMAARHWIFFVLGAGVFLPHWGGFGVQLALLIGALPVLAAGLAATETTQAKLRLLRVPSLLATGALLALVGIASWALSGAAG